MPAWYVTLMVTISFFESPENKRPHCRPLDIRPAAFAARRHRLTLSFCLSVQWAAALSVTKFYYDHNHSHKNVIPIFTTTANRYRHNCHGITLSYNCNHLNTKHQTLRDDVCMMSHWWQTSEVGHGLTQDSRSRSRYLSRSRSRYLYSSSQRTATWFGSWQRTAHPNYPTYHCSLAPRSQFRPFK